MTVPANKTTDPRVESSRSINYARASPTPHPKPPSSPCKNRSTASTCELATKHGGAFDRPFNFVAKRAGERIDFAPA